MQVNLVLFKKSGESKPFPLPSTATVVGRRPDCDLCIPLPVVSRRHCQLYIDQDKLMIRDLGSKNGTLLDGHKIEDEAQVTPGATLQVGPVTFVAQINGDPAEIEPPVFRHSAMPTTAAPDEKAKQHAQEFTDFDHNAATSHNQQEKADDPLGVDDGLDGLGDVDNDAAEDDDLSSIEKELDLKDELGEDEDGFDAELKKELSEN